MIAQLIAAALVIVQTRPALDSAAVTRVLDQLKASDSTVCALAGEALTGYGGWGWENWGYTDQVMPMPQPTPTPTPMPRGGDGEIPVPMGMHGRSHDLDPGVLRAFRAMIRDALRSGLRRRHHHRERDALATHPRRDSTGTMLCSGPKTRSRSSGPKCEPCSRCSRLAWSH